MQMIKFNKQIIFYLIISTLKLLRSYAPGNQNNAIVYSPYAVINFLIRPNSV